MVHLTNAQALAAAATDRLVNVISAPGSGKTTIATERYGYLRYQLGDHRGVAGLTFNRAAAAELRHRIELRWGSKCLTDPHRVTTFDHLHVDLLTHLLHEKKITWPSSLITLDVRDDYSGLQGFRFLRNNNRMCTATLDENRTVVSTAQRVSDSRMGISNVVNHKSALEAGIVSHEDVRSILRSAFRRDDLQKHISGWLRENYRALIVDEVYDADDLDLGLIYFAAEAGLSVTLVGDPWQALYSWRGARPEIVKKLLDATSDRFVDYDQPESFRFIGEQMPKLAANLRAGAGTTIPHVDSNEIDVALARKWDQLWTVGDNILPLAFGTVYNATDAALNLVLDVITRVRLGRASYGRESAIAKLGIDSEDFQARQDEAFQSIIAAMISGKEEADIIESLREAITTFKARKPKKRSGKAVKPRKLLNDKEIAVQQQIAGLTARLQQDTVIPGLTVFQAKGLEWERVGVALSQCQLEALTSGLQALDEEHCIIYVAVTRAKRLCGLLTNTTDRATNRF